MQLNQKSSHLGQVVCNWYSRYRRFVLFGHHAKPVTGYAMARIEHLTARFMLNQLLIPHPFESKNFVLRHCRYHDCKFLPV